MVIELSTLPQNVQSQVLHNGAIQFADNGKIVATFARQLPINNDDDSLMEVCGMLKGRIGDGLEWERNIRAEWD